MDSAPPTIRSLARQLGLSPTTVSESLRGVARVRPATAARVRAAAKAIGYHPKPLAGRVMSQLRSGRLARFRGTLALLDLKDEGRPARSARYHAQLISGAEDRARELGFSIDRFFVGRNAVSPERLSGILATRAIEGVLVLPSFSEVHLEPLDWSHCSGIYLDRVIRFPRLNSVSPDHFGGLFDTLRRLESRGYRRPGLVLCREQDVRLQHRWKGAFLANCDPPSQLAPVPSLVAERIDRANFQEWLLKYQPDVVIGHDARLRGMMEEAGWGVPQRCGFVSLNAALVAKDVSAIDLRPYEIGVCGVELLVGQLLRGESGLASVPRNTSIPAGWQEGTTLRSPLP